VVLLQLVLAQEMRKRNIQFVVIFVLGFVCFSNSVKSQQNSLSLLNQIMHVYYCMPSNDTVYYSFSPSTIPSQLLINSYFFCTFHVEAKDASFNTPLMRTYISGLDNSFIDGYFILPQQFQNFDSIAIHMRSRQNQILSTQYIPLYSKDLVFYSDRTKIPWIPPFFYLNQSYILSRKYPQLFYSRNLDSFSEYMVCDAEHLFTPTLEGTYFFVSDTNSLDTVFSCIVVPESFPKMNIPNQMLQNIQIVHPLLRVDSLLQTSIGHKLELDKFWLQASSNNETQAKNAIATYYSRIEYANMLFTTSCSRGFETDKGISYILFGPPLYMHKYDDFETWYYNSDTIDSHEILQFRVSDYSCNSWQISENKFYTDNKKLASLYWQKGMIFNLQTVQ